MRTVLVFAVAAVSLAASGDLAEARKGKRTSKGPVYGYQAVPKAQAIAPPSSDDSADCVRASGRDPARQFGNLPCWARSRAYFDAGNKKDGCQFRRRALDAVSVPLKSFETGECKKNSTKWLATT